MRKTATSIGLGLAVLLLAGAPRAASGATIAVHISGGGNIYTDDDTNGWRFQALQAIDVVKLGTLDLGGAGLATATDVGLWDDSGTLLASVTVPAGTAGEYVDQFRYAAISPLPLTAGSFYRIGASPQTGAVDHVQNTALTVAPEIAFDAGYYASSSNALTFPDIKSEQGTPGEEFFGGNFQFDVIPEPITFALAALGMAGLGGYVRRRRRA